MTKGKRVALSAEARRRNIEQMARLGQVLRQSRRQRRLTQAGLGRRVGLAQSTISQIENGEGGSHTLDTWQRLAIALDRSLGVSLSRDRAEEPADAGHLAIQELALRTARPAGYVRRFELNASGGPSSRSTDVGLIAPVARRIVLIECVNTVTDFGAEVRASHRKRAELEDFATARGGAWSVGSCWVVRDVTRNRALFRRYPEIVAAAFPGSSIGWLRALTTGSEPPNEPGIVCAMRA